jgi:hypothetical protein
MPENIFGLALLSFAWITGYWFIRRALSGKVPKVRKIAALGGIDEAIGRATEMGRPVHWTHGHGGAGLYSDRSGDHMAGLSILSYVARRCFELGAELKASVGFAEMVPVAEDVIYQQALATGHPEYFKRDLVLYNTDNWIGYDLYTMTSIVDMKAGANILTGNVDTTTGAIIACGGILAGAMNIVGSRRADAIAQMVPFSDYFLMGDELPAAGAIISGDVDTIACVISGDLSKILYIVIIFMATIMSTLGLSIDWLKL